MEQALGVKDTNPERQKDFTRLSHSMDLSPGNLKYEGGLLIMVAVVHDTFRVDCHGKREGKVKFVLGRFTFR